MNIKVNQKPKKKVTKGGKEERKDYSVSFRLLLRICGRRKKLTIITKTMTNFRQFVATVFVSTVVFAGIIYEL